jgi:Uma2 family endonuclease
MVAPPDLALRSLDASWDRARWASLPADGNCYEVIEGVLYVRAAPSFFHQWIIRQIFLTLFAQVDGAGIGLTIWSPLGLFMPGCEPVQPDVIVVRAWDLGIIHDRCIEGVLAFLVEVLSPNNAKTAIEVKRKAYARASVSAYWIARPALRDLLVYSQADTTLGDYAHSERIASDAELASPMLPVRTPAAAFFADAPDTTL